MKNIKITQIRQEEIAALQQISKQTFLETFSATNAAQDMEKYIVESFSLKKLEDELKNPDSFFYFAMDANRVIGYLKLNIGLAQTEIIDKDSMEIQRIYVLTEYQGKKVGQQLFEKAIAIATQMEFKCVWLGVWEKNEKAIGFYKKNGFIEFDKHIFNLGRESQTDIMMKKNII